MSRRLTQLTPEQLSSAQRSVYDGITGGDRLKGTQHFPVVAVDGSLNGPFGIMLHAPGVGSALQELGAAIRYQAGLSGRIREIAILLVGSALRSDFEWWAHERVGRAVGLTEDELGQLSEGRFQTADVVEQTSADLCTSLLENNAVTEQEYARYADVLGVEAIIELTTLVGYYRTLAQLMAVFDIGIPN
ncbi:MULTISPECIES: carboxymuconolactone decarboxylase family protein [unclassified Mycolicibacterium]|uniref:carboxymuconolactone decarboxylase family protein n=1 Tax=unclassified Mycolicibacterium TaxID=2636767 RepID=UPI0012DD91D3|nr:MULTISPECIES: carboxymuconolactone decarboxylase family protein [unclassified Mycolicibacterium]MUL80667.1 carboxymuconolactone decarboxylase family protein [Mycolicibacterium sp. CBMA 329]MUL86434.1 carboxymuconolactone decarboxylase family protein [Mycolicibacterium sp. CBMA 331]MUM01296.1 carboxymuconolactone decarboxylase family protein [Mycolicibacterium sp. CBMA 334]MUM29031.1 carboxymuconolactone decarboxylase family protein [Mycolicibacterium sp. CBMA 295]MUM36730.1 carboxymuconolac